MRLPSNVISTLAGAALLMAACGGIAVIDDTGSGGAGGSSSSGSVTATGTASSAVMSSSTGIVGSLCEAACDSLSACGGGGEGCVEGCLQRQQAPCGEIHQNWLSCSLGETNTMCGFGPGAICGPDLLEYLNCTMEVVGVSECAIGADGSCFCEGFISPGVDIAQICEPNSGCQCLLGGQPVGFCAEPDNICDMFTGCCAGPLFTSNIF